MKTVVIVTMFDGKVERIFASPKSDAHNYEVHVIDDTLDPERVTADAEYLHKLAELGYFEPGADPKDAVINRDRFGRIY